MDMLDTLALVFLMLGSGYLFLYGVSLYQQHQRPRPQPRQPQPTRPTVLGLTHHIARRPRREELN